MGPDQRRLERQSSMPSERPKSNYGNYPMRYFKISAYGAVPQAGIVAGRWPFGEYPHLTSKGQRPDPYQIGATPRDHRIPPGKGHRPAPFQIGATPQGTMFTRPKGLQTHPIPDQSPTYVMPKRFSFNLPSLWLSSIAGIVPIAFPETFCPEEHDTTAHFHIEGAKPLRKHFHDSTK